jgi:hypothetical protein
MTEEDRKESKKLMKFMEDARTKVNSWPEWKRSLKLTQYSKGFGEKQERAKGRQSN